MGKKAQSRSLLSICYCKNNSKHFDKFLKILLLHFLKLIWMFLQFPDKIIFAVIVLQISQVFSHTTDWLEKIPVAISPRPNLFAWCDLGFCVKKPHQGETFQSFLHGHSSDSLWFISFDSRYFLKKFDFVEMDLVLMKIIGAISAGPKLPTWYRSFQLVLI